MLRFVSQRCYMLQICITYVINPNESVIFSMIGTKMT